MSKVIRWVNYWLPQTYLLAGVLFLLVGADGTSITPTWTDLAQLGANGILALFCYWFVTGKIVPGTLLDRAEKRADAAIAAAALSSAGLEKANGLIATLTAAVTELRQSVDGKARKDGG